MACICVLAATSRCTAEEADGTREEVEWASKMGQKLGNLRRSHLPGMPLAMEENKPPRPAPVRLLSAHRVMPDPAGIPHLVLETARRTTRRHRSGDGLIGRHMQRVERTAAYADLGDRFTSPKFPLAKRNAQCFAALHSFSLWTYADFLSRFTRLNRMLGHYHAHGRDCHLLLSWRA